MFKRLLSIPLLLAGIHSWAQDSTARTLDEVTVTANKFPQKQSATGKVITVISKDQIEKSSGRTVGQLLNEQAGITINGALNNMGTNQAIYLRGGSSGRTLVLLDGIPVYDPSLINNEFDINLLSLNDIERIEICRGAQSTLYGSDAVAGVINIITVKSDVKKPFNVKATLGAGSYDTWRGNVQLYGKAGKLTYTARYAKLKTKGFSAAYDSSKNKSFDKDGYDGDVANAAVQFQATPELSLRAFTQYNRYKTDFDANAFIDEKDFVSTNKSMMAGGGFQYHKGATSITGNYQYSDIKRNLYNDSLDTPGLAKFSTDDYYGRNQFIELYANTGLFKGLNLLQGADYRFSSMNNQYASVSIYGPYNSEFKDTNQSQASVFASLFYNAFNERLNLELGGRLNVHSRYGSNYTYTFNPSFNLNSHFRIFGSIATAFKAPSLYQLYSSYGKADLKPERSNNYEVGVQQKHALISSRIVYFHRIIKDGIDFNNIIYQYFNFNKQTVKGLELETAIQPVKRLTVTLNYTYLHPKENSQSRVTFNDTTYDHLLRRPQHNVNLTAGYQVNDKLYVSLSGKYVSSRYDVGGYMAEDIKLDDYMIFNAYAEYRFPKFIKLFADVQNFSGKRFYDIRGYNSIPFLLNAGVTFNW